MNKTDNTNINKGVLNNENAEFYQTFGYLIARQLFTFDEIEKLKRETLAIFKGSRGIVEGIREFNINTAEEEILKNYIAIHFPHKISEVILNYVKHDKISRILTGLVSPNVKCMQSMLFVKSPGMRGQSWHQDEFYIPTRDRSLTGAWIAIDDASVENGCLWVIPGSHKDGYIRKRLTNTSDEYADQTICDLTPYKEEKNALPVEVSSGDVIFFNGYLLHRSLKNKCKNSFRRALVNHYMGAESMLPWDWDGNIPLKEDMRDIIMVAGKDPYAYKGTELLTRPVLRDKRAKVK